MKRNLLLLVAVLCFLLGQVSGMLSSDIATWNGFPYAMHTVELVHEQTAAHDFRCTVTGALIGTNLSTMDKTTDRQKDCILVLAGTLNSDGSFNAYRDGTTWFGRWASYGRPVVLPAQMIKKVTPV